VGFFGHFFVVRSVLHLTISQVNKIFLENAFGAVMHFAAIAYVGESTMELLRCKS
jgi:UDP-glucose 4-epimerase